MAMLTVADNAGSPSVGAVATISGSSGGANTVYVQKVNGAVLGGDNWAVGGTRTGDGTVSLTLATGYYFAYCQTGTTAASQPVYFVVTNGLDSVATRCRAAIEATIRLLDTTLIPPAARVYTRWHESDKLACEWPCVILSTEGQRETELPYTQGLDDIGRPTLVVIADAAVHQMDRSKMPQYELWREKIQRLFRRQRLAGVIEVKWCEIEPAGILEDAAYKGMVVASAFNIRVRTREPRGLGV